MHCRYTTWTWNRPHTWFPGSLTNAPHPHWKDQVLLDDQIAHVCHCNDVSWHCIFSINTFSISWSAMVYSHEGHRSRFSLLNGDKKSQACLGRLTQQCCWLLWCQLGIPHPPTFHFRFHLLHQFWYSVLELQEATDHHTLEYWSWICCTYSLFKRHLVDS